MTQQSTHIKDWLTRLYVDSTATYKCLSSFTNTNCMTKKNNQKTKTKTLKTNLEMSRAQDSSLQNHNCAYRYIHLIIVFNNTAAQLRYIAVPIVSAICGTTT